MPSRLQAPAGGPDRFPTRPRRVRPRQWTHHDRRLVEAERHRRPWNGRTTIHAILRRNPGFTLSAATVGRILAHGVRAGRAAPASHCEGRAASAAATAPAPTPNASLPAANRNGPANPSSSTT